MILNFRNYVTYYVDLFSPTIGLKPSIPKETTKALLADGKVFVVSFGVAHVLQNLPKTHSRSAKDPKLSHSFHVVVLERAQRNKQRFITHVHSHCFAHQIVCLVKFLL